MIFINSLCLKRTLKSQLKVVVMFCIWNAREVFCFGTLSFCGSSSLNLPFLMEILQLFRGIRRNSYRSNHWRCNRGKVWTEHWCWKGDILNLFIPSTLILRWPPSPTIWIQFTFFIYKSLKIQNSFRSLSAMSLMVEGGSFTSFSVRDIFWFHWKLKKCVTSHDILVRKTTNGWKKGHEWGWGWRERERCSIPGQSS